VRFCFSFHFSTLSFLVSPSFFLAHHPLHVSLERLSQRVAQNQTTKTKHTQKGTNQEPHWPRGQSHSHLSLPKWCNLSIYLPIYLLSISIYPSIYLSGISSNQRNSVR